MLIARVYVFLEVRGQQFKYKGHVVHFLRDTDPFFQKNFCGGQRRLQIAFVGSSYEISGSVGCTFCARISRNIEIKK
jgi:hypothetical protein